MVEPVTIGAIVAVLAAKALDRAADETVDAGLGAMRRMVDALRERFTSGDDEAGREALQQVADAPDSPTRVRRLAELVDARAEQSTELRLELERLVEGVREAGVDVGSIEQTAIGSQNVQNASIFDSEVNVNQGVSPPPRD